MVSLKGVQPEIGGRVTEKCPGPDENSRMIHVSQGPISPHLDNHKRWPPSYVEFISDLHQTQGPGFFWCPSPTPGWRSLLYECAALEGTQPSLRFHQILSLGNTDSPPSFEAVLFQPARGSQGGLIWSLVDGWACACAPLCLKTKLQLGPQPHPVLSAPALNSSFLRPHGSGELGVAERVDVLAALL